MTINDLNLANSSLEIKTSGSPDVSEDLSLPDGKSISQLLNDPNNNLPTNKKTLLNDPKKEKPEQDQN